MTTITEKLKKEIARLEAHRRDVEMSDDKAYTNGRIKRIDDDLSFARKLLEHAAFHEHYKLMEAAGGPVIGVEAVDNKTVVKLPSWGSAEAAGADLHAHFESKRDFMPIPPRERALVPTGLIFAIPKGYEGQVRPRSGLALKNGITVLNTPGTLDSDYRGEVRVLLLNTSNETFVVNHGDRIAQLVIAKIERPTFAFTGGVISDTARGTGGFGSTGV